MVSCYDFTSFLPNSFLTVGPLKLLVAPTLMTAEGVPSPLAVECIPDKSFLLLLCLLFIYFQIMQTRVPYQFLFEVLKLKPELG